MTNKERIAEARALFSEPHSVEYIATKAKTPIPELADALEKAVNENRWIPVGERLPNGDVKCLCRYIFRGHNDLPFYQTLEYFGRDETPHFQHTLGIDGMEVTHWMPLPAAPEEER